jgi:uncharacterized protein YabE (DUF348 family)
LAVIYSNFKTVTIVIDGKSTQYKTFKNTVNKVLQEENIVLGPKDKVKPSLNSKISKNSTINIKRAFNVNLLADGKNLNILTAEENVASMLKAEGIALREKDKITPPIDTKIEKNMKIEIIRVDVKTLSESKNIDFNTVIKTDNNLVNTVRKTIQEGKPGEKKVNIEVTYENGKEVSRKILEEIIVKKPQDKIIVAGALPALTISRGGNAIPYTNVFTAKATAYSPTGGAISAYTASGRKAVRNPNGYSTIAVDPNIIPYGTKLYVENYGFAIAADCGSAIKGNKIDVFFNTKSEALKWAVKYVKVYVLK